MGRNVIQSFSRKNQFLVETGTPTVPFVENDFDPFIVNNVFNQYCIASEAKEKAEKPESYNEMAKLKAAQEIKALEARVIVGILSNEITARTVADIIDDLKIKLGKETSEDLRNKLLSYKAFLVNAAICAAMMSKIARDHEGTYKLKLPSPATKCRAKVDFLICVDGDKPIPVICRSYSDHTTAYSNNSLGLSIVNAYQQGDLSRLDNKKLGFMQAAFDEFDVDPVYIAVSYPEFLGMIRRAN